MLTEEYLKDNLITAYFVDNERKNIEIVVRSEDQKSVFTEITPFDENNEQWNILSKFINLDQLHELTYQKAKNERQEFEKSFITIAKKEGLVFDENKIDTRFFPYLVKALFEEQENIDHLFALKLALFEIPSVRDSKNDEAKKTLRKSKTKLEAIQSALDCVK